jgi:ferredoxin
MKRIFIADQCDPVLVTTNSRVLEVARQSTPIVAVCGGKGLCATCHVHVMEGADSLSPMTPREQLSLQMLVNRQPSSRLACQAKIVRDGVRLSLPLARYLTSTEEVADCERLVGRRAEDHILHPIDGRMLVEAGKLVTRTRIESLRQAKVDLENLRTRTISIGSRR